jgi:hypothetical protein
LQKKSYHNIKNTQIYLVLMQEISVTGKTDEDLIRELDSRSASDGLRHFAVSETVSDRSGIPGRMISLSLKTKRKFSFLLRIKPSKSIDLNSLRRLRFHGCITLIFRLEAGYADAEDIGSDYMSTLQKNLRDSKNAGFTVGLKVSMHSSTSPGTVGRICSFMSESSLYIDDFDGVEWINRDGPSVEADSNYSRLVECCILNNIYVLPLGDLPHGQRTDVLRKVKR